MVTHMTWNVEMYSMIMDKEKLEYLDTRRRLEDAASGRDISETDSTHLYARLNIVCTC